MSDVRENLERALAPSAIKSRLGMTWGRHFAVATDLTVRMYQDGLPSDEFLNLILANYTEQEIITILAAARLEGVWTPE